MNFPIPVFSNEWRARAKASVLLAAKYIHKTQVWHKWPSWTADAGRIAHTLPFKAGVVSHKCLSLTWDSARSTQALLSAYKLSPDEEILTTAKRAISYSMSTQIFEPEFPQHRGACFEETPHCCAQIAARDTVEAMQGFINMYVATKEEVYLLRATAAADWFDKYFMIEGNGFPHQYVYARENDRLDIQNDFTRLMIAPIALPFLQLDTITGTTNYAARLPLALDWVLENSIEKDGSFQIHDGTDVGHHAANSGPLANCFVNDDGLGVALLASWRITGEKKYLDAAVANGEWWLSHDIMPETFSARPSALLFFLDLYRATSDERYLKKSEVYAEETLALQVLENDNEILVGGFRGADGLNKKDGIEPLDMMSLRTTMYAMLSLSKMAATSDDEWNMAYSAFGW